MAANAFEELNSFVWKFSSLWAAGSNATLIFESHAGEACASLRLGFGGFPYMMNICQNDFKKKASPSRIRRREKRAAAAKCKKNIVAAEGTIVEDVILV